MKKWLSIGVRTILLLGIVVVIAACDSGSGYSSEKIIKIAMLPKFKGESYFDAVKIGAQEAINELNANGQGVELLYDGPPQDQATGQRQVDILEGWIAQDVDVIIVSAYDAEAIVETLKKAMDKGIRVITFDADSREDARHLFVNQVTAEGVALGLVSGTAEKLMEKGYGSHKPTNIALVSTTKTETNQQSWIKEIKVLLTTEEYSWMKINNETTDIYYPGPNEANAQIAAGLLIGRMGEHGEIQGAIGLGSISTPALGIQYEAATIKPDKRGIVMVGLATPNAIKSYIKNDSNPMDAGVLWNCMDLGYLAVQSGYQLASGEITEGSASITAGRLGRREISDRMVVLGPALIFDQSNVDSYNY